VANSDINTGAGFIASLNLDGQQQVRLRKAAREMGVSEQQAGQMIQRAIRKIERKGKDDSTLGRVVDSFIQKGAKVAQLGEDMPENLADQAVIREIANSEVEYGEFGNQDELQNFGGRDEQGNIKNADEQLRELERARGKKDPNVLTRTYYVKGNSKPQTEEIYIPDGMPVPARFVEPAKNRDFGIYQEGRMAPAAQVQGIERARLQEGVDQFGADAFPGAADVIGRIDDDIKGGKAAEQSLVRELVSRDRQRQNAEVVEANNWRAQAAANLIGQDFTVGGRGAAADQAMANIGNIAQLGPAKVGYDFQVSNNPVDRGTAIPSALPLNLPDQYNAPATDNRFVGPLQKQQQWLADNTPGFKAGKAFGDYPQVAIGEQLAAAQAAIERINFGTKTSPMMLSLGEGAIGTLDDLQYAVDEAAALGQQQGIKFYDLQDGNNVYVSNPGINEVLQKGGMNQNQRADVARALFAVEAARRNPANQVAKNFYEAGMGQPARRVEFGGNHEALGGGMVQIAKLRGEKIKGQEVRGKLQALTGRVGNDTPLNQAELADARMPLIGGVQGQGVERAQFVRKPVMGPGPERLMSTDEIYERYGPVNGQIANAIVQRWEQAQGSNPDGFGVRVERQRNMDPSPVSRFDVGPDPWTQPVGTGNGITAEVARRSSPSPKKALPYGVSTSGPSQGPRPSAYSTDMGIQPDGPNSYRTNVRSEADYRQAVRNLGRIRGYGRNAAIAGGGVAALAGIDGLINGERNKREEEQYR
jgi:hypothetical protein